MQEISRRLGTLAEASQAQSEGLQAVSQNVGSLDEITRENAVAVERSTAASRVLADQAEALRRAVSSMRLRQGTADEARDLVERAVAEVEAQGFDAAARAFNDPDGGWVDRDLYLFALDRSGRYHVAGGRPGWLGRCTHELPGVSHAQAEAFTQAAWATVAQGGGWIEYMGVHPQTLAQVSKTAYIVGLADDLYIGCSVARRGEVVDAPVDERLDDRMDEPSGFGDGLADEELPTAQPA